MKFSLLALFFFCATPLLWSQTDTSIYRISLDELLNREIQTGTFLSLEEKEAPLNITVITHEQFLNSGARHLSELLEIYVPGFVYSVNKWNGLTWGMRGINSDRNTKFIFLVNGHKMNLESRDGALTEVSLGLLGDIDRVEVLRGPAGLVYGSGAIAGVVNVVTKTPKEKTIQTISEVDTWSGDTYNQSHEVLASFPLQNGWQLTLSGGIRTSEGVGMENSRIWGRPSFPAPYATDLPQPSVPSNGSYWETPGNHRASISLSKDNFTLYSRFTNQVFRSHGFFMRDLWPEVNGQVASLEDSARAVFVDGVWYDRNSWYAETELTLDDHREYVLRNWSTFINYDKPIGINNLRVNAGIDLVTDRIQTHYPHEYIGLISLDSTIKVLETFGERRFNTDFIYEFRGFDKLKLAAGYQFRAFIFGGDMKGDNFRDDAPNSIVVGDKVSYLNNALFYEGNYDLNDHFRLFGGTRYDIHSRTKQHGGAFSHNYGVQYFPNKKHQIKLFYRSAANNGTADNYELNRFYVDLQGNTIDQYHYLHPELIPTINSTILPPAPTQEELERLKPEKVQSLELGYQYFAGKTIRLRSSLTYNRVNDLFTWIQPFFRSVNGGQYDFVNLDIDASFRGDRWELSLNHAWQRPVNTDVLQSQTITVADNNNNDFIIENGEFFPDISSAELVEKSLYPIIDAITVDGENFLNLPTHLTKLAFSYQLGNNIQLSTNARIWWGMRGREEVFNFNASTNTNENLLAAGWEESGLSLSHLEYKGTDTKPMIKWNLSARVALTDELTLSLLATDLLGGTGGTSPNRHAVRFQNVIESLAQNDLYAMDLRSFRIRLDYKL